MIEAIIYILIGVFIGWSIPQPVWAKNLTDKVKALFSKE